MSPENQRQPNRLIHATSPYLLQHAHNPVDWFEWGEEALTRAARERKPILVSIGYSSCHWCHVMERESFESPDIAHIMNEYFVCIKVDREERPDIDHLYMEAVQAMGVNGGWPLNVFLTPDQKPFYGGTYFPPANWARLLQQITLTFREKRQDIESSASQLSEHLKVSDLDRFRRDPEGTSISSEDLDAMFQILQERFDNVWGGMARAPKFVMPTIWMFLLRYYFITRNPSALNMVTLTLTRMSEGGLYDQLGGGFARYSVDKEWFAPHFEKMLYDNAQLLSLYSEAYAITQNPIFRKVVFETVGWLRREMLHPSGGFYSALDADSEGIEGQYYTWTQDELNNLLGEKAKPFSQLFQTTPNGNWEHGRNILRRHRDGNQETDITAEKEILFRTRGKRVPPLLDDKVLTGWNAMMIKGLLDAHNAFEEPAFLELARNAMEFLEKFLCENKKYYRSFRNSRSPTEGFLEDYAMLIQAGIALYQSTFEEAWLTRASALTEYCLENFFDQQEGYFHFSGKSGEQLIAGKKEIFDNVIPSSNSVMARNLYHLGILLDRQDWKQLAAHMVNQLRSVVRSEPGYLSHWGILMTEMIHGISEVVMVGPQARETRSALGRIYLPFAVRLGTESKSTLPLLEGRDATDEKTRIYVCFEKTCRLPVETVNDALKQLNMN